MEKHRFLDQDRFFWEAFPSRLNIAPPPIHPLVLRLRSYVAGNCNFSNLKVLFFVLPQHPELPLPQDSSTKQNPTVAIFFVAPAPGWQQRNKYLLNQLKAGIKSCHHLHFIKIIWYKTNSTSLQMRKLRSRGKLSSPGIQN